MLRGVEADDASQGSLEAESSSARPVMAMCLEAPGLESHIINIVSGLIMASWFQWQCFSMVSVLKCEWFGMASSLQCEGLTTASWPQLERLRMMSWLQCECLSMGCVLHMVSRRQCEVLTMPAWLPHSGARTPC